MGFPGHVSRFYNIVRFALSTFSLGCVLLFVIFSFRLALNESFAAKFVKLDQLPYVKDDAAVTLYASQSYAFQWIAFAFIPGFLAALAMLVHEEMSSKGMVGDPHWNVAADRIKSKLKRLLCWQVPGQRFWLWWCGGLNLAEVLFFLTYVAATVSWLQYYLASQYKFYDKLEQGLVMEGKQTRSLLNLESWGLCFGLALYPCFLFLFWPCSHDSFVNYMFGIPWQAMIKYHRWMGHWTMAIMGLHGVLYYVLWGLQHQFWSEFKSWEDSIPFLPGSIAWFCGLVLQFTSLYFFRRRLFEIFYRVHIIMFIGVLLFSTIHYSYSWVYFMPGLMPYAVDIAFRIAQASNLTTISASTITEDQSMTSFQLTMDKGVKTCPLQDVFVNIPSISRWQWHPFTIADMLGSAIIVHTKRYGQFTQEMIKMLGMGTVLPVRIIGPIGIGHSERCNKYRTLVCVAGGIGISPILGFLNDLIRARRDGKPTAVQKVFLLWTSRHKAEFTVLDEDFLATALAEDRDGDKWLEVELHYTGTHMNDAVSIKQHQAELKEPVKSQDDTGSSEGGGDIAEGETHAAGGVATGSLVSFNWMSPLGFSQARPAQPKIANGWQAAASIVLSYVGCFAVMTAVQAYYAEPSLIGIFSESSSYKYWKMGALIIFGMLAGAMGLPVFATHTVAYWRYFRDVRRSKSGAPLAVPNPADFHVSPTAGNILTKTISGFQKSELGPAKRYAATLVGAQVGIVESNLLLDIYPCRPNITELLTRVSASLAVAHDSTDVGVIVGGPESMVHAAKVAVATVNSRRGKHAPFLDFQLETHSM